MWRSGGGLGKGLGSSSSNPEGFNCPACGRVYKLKSSLRNHQKWECGKEPQFQCPHCVYRAKQKMHIARHMERMHKEKIYKQELEQESSSGSDHHRVVPIGRENFKSTYGQATSKTCVNSGHGLLIDKQNELRDSVFCDSRRMPEKFGMNRAVRFAVLSNRSNGSGDGNGNESGNENENRNGSEIHTGECTDVEENNTGLFHAKHAKSAFENFPELALSMKKHVCTCGKVYNQKSSLDRHQRYECGKMPNVPCLQCGKMFKYKHHVTQHLKSCRIKDSRNLDFPNYA
ncbi:hypothetical protein E2986_13552 [Frieseomelitta varia]|uniref:C2H2-type domain-containing protein n=1 Tax=Frieseomelitta varia TaxID=561572 RepID=A0A833S0N7_9HYME|nr:hypothetical protein E2986_13552 [Frieseomelitta varia]